MKKSKFLQAMKPYLRFVPQVEPPKEKPNMEDKLIWTVGTLLVFLVASQTELLCIVNNNTPDPIHWFRAMLASRRGTLMELGVSPIVTSGLVLQLLAGSRMISVDHNNNDEKALFQATQKLFAILIAFGEAIAYVLSGMYGNPITELGIFSMCIIVVQLVAGGIVAIMLDELLQRGYGMGSGISLFMAANICENILWQAFSPSWIMTASGVQYEGAMIALFHLLLTRKRTIPALKEAFYRNNLPNITNLMATVVVFIVVIYFQGFRVELVVRSPQGKGTQGQTKYPIKLFYTSNIPIIMENALVSNIYLLSQICSNRFGSNIITNILGQWRVNPHSGINTAVGGLAYYISPPHSLFEILSDPIHSIIYISFVLLSCAWFSKLWIRVSGSAPKDVAKQLHDQRLVLRGRREVSTVDVLNRYIPPAAELGGVCIGALTVFADFMGAIGSGTGILLCVTIIFELFEAYIKEAQEQGVNLGIPQLMA